MWACIRLSQLCAGVTSLLSFNALSRLFFRRHIKLLHELDEEFLTIAHSLDEGYGSYEGE